MCGCCSSLFLSYGLLVYVALNLKTISGFLSSLWEKRSKLFLWPGLATFASLTVLFLKSR